MATQSADVATGVFEKIGDAFSSASERFMRFLTRMFGSDNERQIRALGYVRGTGPDATPTILPGSFLARVNDLEASMQALTDAELAALTPKFRQRLAQGETLDDLMPEAFAACREAARRTKNMRHYDVQILGGAVLHRGCIAEMKTGEGKTLVATLAAYLNALPGKGVHIVTVNDYLARRDCEWMLPIYRALGITAGYIQSDMDSAQRRAAYDCDITYGTNSEFGFDYLRDNMKWARWDDTSYPPHMRQCQRPLNYAIIDEVDNILIDEARTPLIISGPAYSDQRRYEEANRIAVQLIELQKREPGKYFEVKEKEHTCHLTDEGIRKAEELAGVESFYTAGNMEWPHLIDNALKAHNLYKRDRNYIIGRDRDTGELGIIIVDEFTGRTMEGRQWSDGLHQAVEAKHARDGVRIKQETQTLATITLQNYFKLYSKLAGMTGTAMTEAVEFWNIYKLQVIELPTNKPLRRVELPDQIYLTEKSKWNAIVEEIERIHKYDVLALRPRSEHVTAEMRKAGDYLLPGTILADKGDTIEFQLAKEKRKLTIARADIEHISYKGRPILVGTTDVAKSEKLAEMLKRRGIKFELLNAKPENVAREAEIVAQAGRLGAVTISTNMAGRGTDIILGGNPETLAWAQLKQLKAEDGRPLYASRLEVPEDVWKKTVEEIEAREKMKEEGRRVAELGGLHVIGTERHESRRIDNQLLGRAGRQGDPGSSRFYISMEDDLMRLFGGERVARMMASIGGMTENDVIEHSFINKQIRNAQKRVEERHYETRKHLLEYDEVMAAQRKSLYGKRQAILDGANPRAMILEMADQQIAAAVKRFLADDYGRSAFAEYASRRLTIELEPDDFYGTDYEGAVRVARDRAFKWIPTFVQDIMDENLSTDVDSKEWQWSALANTFNSRFGTKYTDRQLKQIGRDQLAQTLINEAMRHVETIDLSGGREFLDPQWGAKSLVDWARLKFGVEIPLESIDGREPAEVELILQNAVRVKYREKSIAFPVEVAFSKFMSERGGGAKYDRQGLLVWAGMRFPGVFERLPEDEFRTQSRSKLFAALLAESQRAYPEMAHEEIEAKLEEIFAGTERAEEPDANEIVAWAKQTLKLELQAQDYIGVSLEQARDRLFNAFDARYRPEMARMERNLLLTQLDQSWKQHLLTMDHLRSGVGLSGYAQQDPKMVYKREGMEEFRRMWAALADRVTDTVMRMEDDGDVGASIWQITSTLHSAAQPVLQQAAALEQQTANAAGQPNAATAPQTTKVTDPIRRTGPRIGRNDPCWCGSGKKYKNCHMRLEATKYNS